MRGCLVLSLGGSEYIEGGGGRSGGGVHFSQPAAE